MLSTLHPMAEAGEGRFRKPALATAGDGGVSAQQDVDRLVRTPDLHLPLLAVAADIVLCCHVGDVGSRAVLPRGWSLVTGADHSWVQAATARRSAAIPRSWGSGQ